MQVLQENAWLSAEQVGRKVNKSKSATAERIQKLLAHGYIRQVTALLNRQLLGKPVMMIALVRLKEHGSGIVAAFGEGMAMLPEVNVCLHLTGKYDFMLQLTMRSAEAYERFLAERLFPLPFVDKVHSSLVLNEMKLNMTLQLAD